jgi:tRNA(Ile)-lysidine synthetase-like protein
MEFLKDWFRHPEWWFKCDPSIDNYLTQNYSHLLETMQDKKEDIYDLYKVIVWDQLPRHIFRNQLAQHIITYYLQKALAIVLQRFHDERTMNYLHQLYPHEVCFFLLPLRHSQQFRHIATAIHYIWLRLEKENSEEGRDIFKRFLRASYQRMPIKEQAENIICYNIEQSSNQRLTEFIPTELKFTNIPSRRFIISLSGGVDSMVCSWILRHQYPSQRLIAIMINYANRDTSFEEVEFVKRWCHKLDIELYVRHITEIHRPQCMKYEMREIYESYTRQVRYEVYKTVWNMVYKENTLPSIILGHNKTDRFENIMTNMTYKVKYENLNGMEFEMIVDNINFYRPLLENFKEDIISFANNHDIPHLPCSTPTFSQRGKIRRNILPVLKEWNAQSIDGFFEMANIMTDMYDVFDKHLDIFIHRFQQTDQNIYEIQNIGNNEIILKKLFWKSIFMKLFGITVSNKSLDQFIEFLQRCLETPYHKDKMTFQFVLHKCLRLKIKKHCDNYCTMNIIFI